MTTSPDSAPNSAPDSAQAQTDSRPELRQLAHYRGYVIELKVVDRRDHLPPDQAIEAVCPELPAALDRFYALIDRHLEYQQIASQFQQSFLRPLLTQGFSKAKILDAIAEFAHQANWPSDAVKSLEYAAAALDDDGVLNDAALTETDLSGPTRSGQTQPAETSGPPSSPPLPPIQTPLPVPDILTGP